MTRPLLIYLDSSDWSQLAAAAGSEPFADRKKWLDIRRRLLAARDAGIAEYRFSVVTVQEAYSTERVHHSRGLERARAIDEVCRKHCLLDANTLWREEARRLALGNPPLGRGIALRDDGAWYPEPDALAARFGAKLLPKMRDLLGQLLKEEVPHLRREDRRKVEAVVRRDGTLEPWVRERIADPAVAQAVRRMVSESFGLPDETPGLDVMARVLVGEVPPSEADQWLQGLMRDLPTCFALNATRENDKAIFGGLRAAGTSIAALLAEAADNMRLFISEVGLRSARRSRANRLPTDLQRFRDQTRARLIAKHWDIERKRRGVGPRVRGEAWRTRVESSSFGSIPALDAFIAAGSGVMAMSLAPSAQPYRGRDSDAGDVMHMTYLPYVDIFRCDSGKAQVARDVVRELHLETMVAPTIEDVLKRIGTEDLAQSGSQS
jgi:hypothetical protein